jgi:D-beta-D-heptose 7-phosphate kinase/D-beta-D-heptose 1-phosphate adenosyltransferase
MNNPTSKIMNTNQARAFRDRLQAEGKRLAFTNGCVDILHRGRVTYLQFAREQADAVCVGLNSDASVKRNKGDNRPINSEEDRAFVMASLTAVDCVVIFDEDELRDLIAKILPQVLIKGRDWAHYVSGRDIVEANGGTVILADMVEGKSTTGTIEKVLNVYGKTTKS